MKKCIKIVTLSREKTIFTLSLSLVSLFYIKIFVLSFFFFLQRETIKGGCGHFQPECETAQTETYCIIAPFSFPFIL